MCFLFGMVNIVKMSIKLDLHFKIFHLTPINMVCIEYIIYFIAFLFFV